MDEHYLSRLRGDMPDDAVDIWHLPLHLDRALWTVLTEAERTRARNIKIIEKRVQFVAGRAQLRHILASYLRCRPGSLQLEVGEHGKPWVQSDPPLSFNLSHSRDAGLLAVTVGQPVSLGVDLEFRKPDRRFQQIATRFFSQAEQQELLARPSAELTPAFYQAWACKEAYLKACGTGLSFPSNWICVVFASFRSE